MTELDQYNKTLEEMERSFASQEKLLLALEPDWDGEGSLSLPLDNVSDMFEELRRDPGNAWCDVAPDADGSLQAEWRLRGSVYIEYRISAQGKRSLRVQCDPSP